MTSLTETPPFGAQKNEPQIWFAPMEGVVDPIVRDLWTRTIGGIDYCVSEFIRVTDKLLPDHIFFKNCPEMQTGGTTAAGVPVIAQLLGGQCEPLALNAARAIELGALAIDLNFGCPAKTVNNHDGGAALLKNPHRVYDVTRAVRQAVPMTQTVSAKMRLGFSDKNHFLEIAQAAEQAGASWLTVHARTRDEGYRPPAHWEYTARIREALRIPVIANGEVWTVEDYWKCREITGCRHVMIGRGLMAKPDLALAIKHSRAHYDWSDYLEFIQFFARHNLEARGESYGASRIKQLLKSISRSQPEAEALFEKIKTHHTVSGMSELFCP